MAETNEIYSEITSDENLQAAFSELELTGDTANQLRNDINNNSVVGIDRIIAWIIAYAMKTQRVLFRIFRQDVRDLALEGHYGTKRWFVAKALQFQFGHQLIFTTKDATYAQLDVASRIVAHAAVVEVAYKVIVKVAKSSGSGLAQLSFAERAAVQDYFTELKPPVQVEVRSAAPDRIAIHGKVVVDAKMGIYNISAAAELAMVNYLQTLDFNGVFSINKMRQAVLAVPGVVDVVFEEILTRISGSETWVNVSRVATAYAGWMIVDTEFPLSQTIQYVSSNV